MEEILTLLLIRFGIIVGLVVIAALIIFAVALHLRKRGRLDEAKQLARVHGAPLARKAAEYASRRLNGRSR